MTEKYANRPSRARAGSPEGPAEGRPRPGAEVQAPQDRLGLEEIVHLTNKIGLEYVGAKKDAERLELLKPTIRAKIALRLEGAGISEAKLRRLTETDPEYIEFLEKLTTAKAEGDRLRVRYESYKNLFEARRSLLSYQKAEMKLL